MVSKNCCFHSYLGMMIPNLTSIFFKGVGSTTNQFFMNHYVDFEPLFGKFMKFEHQMCFICCVFFSIQNQMFLCCF